MASIGLAWAQATKMYEDEVKQKELNSRLKAERKLFDAQLEANIKQAEYMKAVNEPKFRIGTIVANNQDKIIAGDPTASANVYSSMVNDSTKMVTVDPTDNNFVNVVDKATGKVQSRLPVLKGTSGLAYATNLSRNMLEQTLKEEAQADATLAYRRELGKVDRSGEWDMWKIDLQGKNQLASVGASNAGALQRVYAQGGIESALADQRFIQDLVKMDVQSKSASEAAKNAAESASQLKSIDAQLDLTKTLLQNPNAIPALAAMTTSSAMGTPATLDKTTGTAVPAIPGWDTMTESQRQQAAATFNIGLGEVANMMGMGLLSNLYRGANPNLAALNQMTGGIDYNVQGIPQISYGVPGVNTAITPWAAPTAQATTPVTSLPQVFPGTTYAPRWGAPAASANPLR